MSAKQLHYFPPGPTEEGWPAHAVLIYSGFYELGRSGLARIGGRQQNGIERDDDGDWLVDDFMPYVAHLDAQGRPDDTFFDSFIFLGLASGRQRHYAGERDQELASLWADWQWYLDRLFTPGKQLAALDRAVNRVKSALGKPSDRVNVYIMIPYPSYKVTDFGFADGTMGGDSLLPVSNRMMAVQWYVQQLLARWKAWQPKHLRLAGFYWLQEHINPAVPDEEEFVRDVVSYVQQRHLKIGWIPWSGAYLATQWQAYGFDWAIIQPNHMFQDKPGLLQSAVDRARTHRMGIEIELDGRVKLAPGEKKLYEYLDAGVQYGYMNEAMIGYYQDVFMLGQLYHDDNGLRRHMYDDVYAFAKGKYQHQGILDRG